MAERRPLVLVGGRQKELPVGDTLPGAGGEGTVKSVGLSVPTGFSVSDSPVTTSGTIVLSYSAGYRGYTNAENTKLAGIAAGATAGATWGSNLFSIPANIASWASSSVGPADVVTLTGTQTVSGNKTFSGNSVRFSGASGVLIGTGDWRIRADSADLWFRKGTTDRIAITSDGFFRNLSSGFVSSSVIVPSSDSYSSVGTSSQRWNTFYAVTGAINTSDAREKTAVRPLTPAELSAAIELSAEIGVYQWLAMIEAKGDDARLHVGMTVQRAIQIMQSQGLDPVRYGFICYDQWGEAPEELDEDVVQERRTAGDRYIFRMDELLAFIARGAAHRLRDVEHRLAALEAARP